MNKNEIILYIDTIDNKKTVVELYIHGRKKRIAQKTDFWTSQILLPMIQKILMENGIKPNQLTQIRVLTGPGSFTGVRIGVTVANILGWLLGIPINGKKSYSAGPVYTSKTQLGKGKKFFQYK